MGGQKGRRGRGATGGAGRASLLPQAAQKGPIGSSRPAQVAEVVRQVVSTLLLEGGLKDPRLSGAFITVTDVEMSKDLQSGRIFVSVFPEEAEAAARVLAGFRSALPEVRRRVGAALSIRQVPELSFALDRSAAYGARIETVLREIRRTDAGEAEPTGQAQAPGEAEPTGEAQAPGEADDP